MNIVLFGATGHTGRFILDELLKTNHNITVLVRDKSKVSVAANNLHIITGDALSEEDVLQVVTGQDAIFSAISEGPTIQHKTQSTAIHNMIKAMRASGVDRIICMGAIGILQFNANELIRDQPFYPDLYRPLSFEHSAVNKQLHETNLCWTQVCPPTILAASADGKFAVKADYPPTSNMEVNAGNIGSFMISELQKNEFIGKRVGITNI